MKTNRNTISARALAVLLFVCYFQFNLSAQEKQNFFIEINLAQIGSIQPLFLQERVYRISIVNGLRVGKYLGERAELFLSIRRDVNSTERGLIGSYSTFRHQAGLGMNVILSQSEKFKFYLGVELLANHNSYNGTYESDAPFYSFSLDELTILEAGAAAQLQLNYALGPQVAIGISSRIGYYYRPTFRIDNIEKPSRFYRILDPVNMISLRVSLGKEGA